MLTRAVRLAIGGALTTRVPQDRLPSKLRHHPTLWGYCRSRLAERVR